MSKRNDKEPSLNTGLILDLRPAKEWRRYNSNAVSHWLGANLESALQHPCLQLVYRWSLLYRCVLLTPHDGSFDACKLVVASIYLFIMASSLLSVYSENSDLLLTPCGCVILLGYMGYSVTSVYQDDVIKWKHFPRYWPFVWGIHRSPVNSPHKGQWRGALMFFFYYLHLNKRLSKQSRGRWFETLSRPLWRHCNDILRHGWNLLSLLLARSPFLLQIQG